MHAIALALVNLACVCQAHIAHFSAHLTAHSAHNSADSTVADKATERVSNQVQALALLLQSLKPTAGLQVAPPRISIKGAENMRTRLDAIRKKVVPGAVVKGKVVSVNALSAQIDIGTGNNAMLSLSEITSDFLPNVGDVLSEGSSIKALVIKKAGSQVSLSTKVLEAVPGDMIKNPQLVFEMAEEMAAKYKKVWTNLQPGMLVEGVVRHVAIFGAFIDIGIGRKVLLPASEISSSYISNVEDVLSEGSSIKAMVLTKKGHQITLSTKYCEPEPGDMMRNPKLVFEKAEEMVTKYQPGMVVEGVVEKVLDYGAFIDIGARSNALLPTGKVSSAYISNLANVLSEGSKIKALVVKREGNHITLSTRELEQKPGDMINNPELVFEMAEELVVKHKKAWEKLQPGMLVEGAVTAVKHFGAFIDVGTLLPALLPSSEISSAQISNVEDVLSEGGSIKAMILDKAGYQLKLSTKCLEPEPGDMIKNPQLVFERAEETIAQSKEGSDILQPCIVVEGFVEEVMDHGAFIDIGTGKSALLPITEISSDNTPNVEDVLSKGASIKAMVLNSDDDQVTLSTKLLEPNPGDMVKNPELVFEKAEEMALKYNRAWHNLQLGMVVEGFVKDLHLSRASVDVGTGRQALLPITQISSDPIWNSDPTHKIEDVLSEGSRIKAVVLQKSNEITLSTKYLESEPGDMIKNPQLVFERAEEISAKRREALDNLQPGTIVDGVVDFLMPYGAFIDIGTAKPVLLHISEISSDLISNIEDVLAEGSRIKAMVLKKELDGIELSTKFLEPEPGDMIKNPQLVFARAQEIGAKWKESLDSLHPGIVVEGIVRTLKPFGAFIDIGSGSHALLPIGKISSGDFSNVADVLSLGSRIKATVVKREDNQVTLSTAALENEPGDMVKNPQLVFERAEEIGTKHWAKWDSLLPGMVVEGVVDSLEPRGAFIDIGTGDRPFLPIRRISAEPILNVEDVLSEGSRIKVMVIEKKSDSMEVGTADLEPEPGDMIENPQLVFERAEEIGAKRKESLDKLKPGTIVEGVVENLAPYGAFIDIGIGKSALLHINEVSSERVTNIEDVLSKGSMIKAMVLKKTFDDKRGRIEISLSTKALETDSKGVFGRALEMGREYQK